MMVVYVSGPFCGNFIQKKINIYRAKKLCRYLYKNKIMIYSPHLNSGWFGQMRTNPFILLSNIEILRRCDAIFCMDGWKDSQETKQELREAIDNKIPFFFNQITLLYVLKAGEKNLRSYANSLFTNETLIKEFKECI